MAHSKTLSRETLSTPIPASRFVSDLERLVRCDGDVVPFVIGSDPDSPLESDLPDEPSTGTQPKSLTYWYIDQ